MSRVSDFDYDPAFRPRLRVLSLGAGVQSSTLALMASLGEVGPMPDCAIFADTQQEPRAVYDWLNWLEPLLPFPVYRVTAGDLWAAASQPRKTRDGARFYVPIGIPVYTVDGLRKGIGRRQCTRTFKIEPITRKVRDLLGLKRVSVKLGQLVEMWIGISSDEALRMKPSHASFIRSRWPLIEREMSRTDCLDWMKARGYPAPPRSACTFCPFRDDNSWRQLTASEFADACNKEAQLQAAYAQTVFRGTPYFHDSRVPLGQVEFRSAEQSTQLRLRLGKFAGECEGMCGV